MTHLEHFDSDPFDFGVPNVVSPRHLVLVARVELIGAQHDERKGENVGRVAGGEEAGIAMIVPHGKSFHHTVDLLRLGGK